MWHRLVASVLTLPVLHRARLGESRAMASCPLCFVPSLQTMPRTWSNGDRQELDVVWVAFEAVSLLVHVGEAVCGFRTEQPLKQPGSWASPWLWGCLGVRWTLGTLLSVASPSWDCRRIPPFISTHQENSKKKPEEGQELSL